MAEKKTAGTYRRRLEAVSTGAIGRQEAKGMDELISAYIKEMKLGSSVVRTKINFQKDLILHKINDFLAADDLFVKDRRNTHFVKNIILQ